MPKICCFFSKWYRIESTNVVYFFLLGRCFRIVSYRRELCVCVCVHRRRYFTWVLTLFAHWASNLMYLLQQKQNSSYTQTLIHTQTHLHIATSHNQNIYIFACTMGFRHRLKNWTRKIAVHYFERAAFEERFWRFFQSFLSVAQAIRSVCNNFIICARTYTPHHRVD